MKTDETSSGYERSDARVGPLALSAVALFALVALAMFGMAKLFRALDRSEPAPRHPMAAERQVPPAPRLQTDPAGERLELEERDRARLETYGWVDREQGVVRIPLERAMDLVAEEGLPVRAEGDR